MADVTDVPFRTIVAQCGRPDVFYTEFISAHGLASSGRERLLKDLAFTESEHPIVAQFFGTKPEHLFAAGQLARELGFDGVDINMGCPDRSVMKQGAGIALCKEPALAQELIHALRDGYRGPTSIKTRLGLYRPEEMDTWIPALLEAKPDALIVHGRTMKEASKVPVHWDLISRAARMCHDAGVICIGNGDVMSRTQGVELAERWDVDGIMVGRGIFHNPWLFSEVEPREHAPDERIALLREHIVLWRTQWEGNPSTSSGLRKSFDLMKKFFKVYISEWPGAADLRARLMECKTPEQVDAVLSTEFHPAEKE